MNLRAMPGRLWVALVLLGVATFLLGWTIFAWGADAVKLTWIGFAAVLLFYLPRGHPLARQWGFLVAGFEILMGLISALSGLMLPMRVPVAGLLLLTSGVFLWWSLSGQRVRRYFGLYCRGCGSYQTHSRSFLFNRIGCRECGRRWRRGDPVESVESIFE